MAIDLTINLKFYLNFDSYEKLIRFRAIMTSFVNFIRQKKVYTDKQLTFKEIFEAEIQILIQLQREMFLPEKDPKLSSFRTYV